MSRRRRRKPKPVSPEPVKTRERLDSLGYPNHLVPLTKTSGCWPSIWLRAPDESQTWASAFVDGMHGVFDGYIWENHPPTWMDPELFLNLALQDEQVAALCQQMREVNSRDRLKELEALLLELFKEKYLRYIFSRFKRVLPVCAEYALARYSDKMNIAEENADARGTDTTTTTTGSARK